jgi:hypothetical protein
MALFTSKPCVETANNETRTQQDREVRRKLADEDFSGNIALDNNGTNFFVQVQTFMHTKHLEAKSKGVSNCEWQRWSKTDIGLSKLPQFGYTGQANSWQKRETLV